MSAKLTVVPDAPVDLRSFYPATVATLRALGIRGSDERFDDLLQEGVIAAWLAVQTPRQDPATYGRVAMRNRIKRLVSRPTQPFGGSTGTKTYDLHAQHIHRADLVEAEETPAPDSIDQMNLSEDVRAAIRALPTVRERLIAVGVALGHSWAELATDLDAYSWEIETEWDGEVRPVLADNLSHLVKGMAA